MVRSERIRKVEAVIIAHRDYGEADRLIRLFSLEHGKLSAIAKGARKIKSHKAAHIEPFTYSSLVLAKGQTFWILTQADTREGYPGIRENLRKTARAAYILELADHLTGDEQPDSAIFHLITETLKRIDAVEDPFSSVLFFELRLLGFSGFRPDFFHCVSCRKEVQPQDQYFSLHQGGVVCPDCAAIGGSLIPVSQNTLKYLRHFQRSHFSKLANVKVNEKTRSEISRVLNPYISYVTERKLNSPEFLNQINHMEQDSETKNDIQLSKE
jgi:DNA repair protein RecO (recombination protein O)